MNRETGNSGEGEGVDSTKYIITHTHMYRWLWTMAFISGSVPAVILLSVTLICLIFFFLMLHQVIDGDEKCSQSNQSLAHSHYVSSSNSEESYQKSQ